MNYPSDKKNKIKTNEDKISSYLVYIQIGGEQGNWQCRNADYKICNGNTKEDVVKDWIRQVGLSFYDCYAYGDNWTWEGRDIVIIPLYEYWNYGESNWKTLKWID